MTCFSSPFLSANRSVLPSFRLSMIQSDEIENTLIHHSVKTYNTELNMYRVPDDYSTICFTTSWCTLLFSLQSEQLVDLLLNTIMLSVPISGSHSNKFLSFSHGEYFYSLFHLTINTELLRSLDTTVPRLMKASSLNPSMVAASVICSHSSLSHICKIS